MSILRTEIALQTTHHVCQMGRESWPECAQTRQQCQPQLPWLWEQLGRCLTRCPQHAKPNSVHSPSSLRLRRRQSCLQKKSSLSMGAGLFHSAPPTEMSQTDPKWFFSLPLCGERHGQSWSLVAGTDPRLCQMLDTGLILTLELWFTTGVATGTRQALGAKFRQQKYVFSCFLLPGTEPSQLAVPHPGSLHGPCHRYSPCPQGRAWQALQDHGWHRHSTVPPCVLLQGALKAPEPL